MKGFTNSITNKIISNQHSTTVGLKIVFLAVFLVFMPTFDNKLLTGWDDQWQVVNNFTSGGFTWNNLKQIFTRSYGTQYSPLNQCFYILIYLVDGYNPMIFHAASLLIHFMNCCLAYYILRVLNTNQKKIRQMAWITFLTILLFAIHPLQVESVAWMSTSKVLLYTFFYLGATWTFIQYLKKKKLVYYLLTLLFLFFNFQFVQQTDRVISTLPYLLFLVWALILIRQYKSFGMEQGFKSYWKQAGILGSVLFLALETRTEGALLFPALFVSQCCEWWSMRKNKLAWQCVFRFALPYLVVLVLFIVTLPFLPAGYTAHTQHFSDVTFMKAIDNMVFYLDSGALFCVPFIAHIGLIGKIVFWIWVVIGLAKTTQTTVADKVYALTHFTLFAIWPYQTFRYFIPIAPIILYFFIIGIKTSMQSIPFLSFCKSSIMLCCICIVQGAFFMINLFDYSKEYDTWNLDVTSPNVQAVFAYINSNTQSTDIIACCESRTVYLYTGRISCNLFASIDDTVKKADWYVSFRKRGYYLQHLPEDLVQASQSFDEVYRNADFIIYKIN